MIDSSPPNPAPLAALLASHPEEVGAVFSVLVIMDYQSGGIDVAQVRDEVRRFESTMSPDRVRAILDAGIEAGMILTNPWQEHRINRDTRYAITRHPRGVMGWLRERCGVTEPPTLLLDGLRPDQIRRLTRTRDGMLGWILTGYAIDIDGDYFWCRGDRVRVPEDAELFTDVATAQRTIETQVKDGGDDDRVLTVSAVYRRGEEWDVVSEGSREEQR